MGRIAKSGVTLVALGALVLTAILELQACGKGSGAMDSGAVPSTVSGIEATAGDGRVTIVWDLVPNAASYNLYWDTTEGVHPPEPGKAKTSPSGHIASVDPEAATRRDNLRVGTKISEIKRTIYTHNGLSNGTTFYYVVTAVSDGGVEGGPSKEVSATPQASSACSTAMETQCNGGCANLLTDNGNCGACGNVCGSQQVCQSGVCQDSSSCQSPLQTCNGSCVDTQTDWYNCGACGNTCNPNQDCETGVCKDVVLCMFPYSNCGSGCVNLHTNVNNCGACGNACNANQTCETGVCKNTVLCMFPYGNCGAGCVNLHTDKNNCGACGNACGQLQNCELGVCVSPLICLPPTTKCDGACVNTQSDSSNCGACGVQCGSLQYCCKGACRSKTLLCL